MESKEIVRWQDEEALRRFQMIAPLVADGVDSAKRVELRKEIALKYDVSERTIRRYETAYWSNAFEGLKPVSRLSGEVKGPFPGFAKVLDEAILLKREVPSRSVSQIIFILESEKVVEPGKLNRSTLQRYLYRAGFGKKQMKKYTEAQNSSSKRFCKPHRMMLAQADIKYVMKLPIGKNGTKVQCYIAALIDDHSRYILSSGVYDHQDADIVEDIYRKAILKWGTFQSTYVDNGKQFVSTQLIRTLTRLGIKHKRAKPYAAASKGKIEVYNRLINSYIAECKAEKIRTLEEANIFWDLFVEEYYNQNIAASNYFSALDGDKAVAYANKVAERRGDTNDVGKFEKMIEVLIPEAVTIRPEAEHGEGDPFINKINAITEAAPDSTTAGLLAIMATAQEISK